MLVDTSVWVEHLRRRSAALVERLEADEVHVHPFVVGELACGNLSKRDVLLMLARLPHAPTARHEEVLAFVEANRLMGRGLGWVDMHLLASAALAAIPLWTLDQRLAETADRIGLPAA